MASLSLPRARASLPLFLLVGHLSRPISSPSPSRFASNRRISSSPVPPQLKNVGFIGVGNMGSHMANNLIKAGYSLSVYDIDSNVLEKFSKMGIRTAKTSYEIIESSDVVMTMLPSSSHVMDVYTGPNGFLNGRNALRPWLFIDSSTVDPLTSRSISAIVSKSILKEKKGHGDHPVMLDAPVSGGVNGAEAGTLTFMVGGPEEAYLAAQPLFLSMGKVSIYCGGSGNGVVWIRHPTFSAIHSHYYVLLFIGFLCHLVLIFEITELFQAFTPIWHLFVKVDEGLGLRSRMLEWG